jgi:hypothetical protein
VGLACVREIVDLRGLAKRPLMILSIFIRLYFVG